MHRHASHHTSSCCCGLTILSFRLSLPCRLQTTNAQGFRTIKDL